MTPLRIGAFLLVVLGALGLAYGKFSYTEKSRETKLGPIEFTLKDQKTIRVPPWLGVSLIVIGGIVLLVAKPKK